MSDARQRRKGAAPDQPDLSLIRLKTAQECASPTCRNIIERGLSPWKQGLGPICTGCMLEEPGSDGMWLSLAVLTIRLMQLPLDTPGRGQALVEAQQAYWTLLVRSTTKHPARKLPLRYPFQRWLVTDN